MSRRPQQNLPANYSAGKSGGRSQRYGKSYGSLPPEATVRIATNKYMIIDEYEAPQSFSGDDKMQSVAGVLYDSIAESVRKPERVKCDAMEDTTYIGSSRKFCFCLKSEPEPENADSLPNPTEVFQFIRSVIRTAKMSYDVSIVGLILVERFTKKANIILSISNWRPIVLSSMIVACKTWGDDEVRFCNAHLSRNYKITEFSLKQINSFEKYFLEIIQYDVSVTSALYSHYYFGIIGKTTQSESNNFRTKYYGRSNMAENIAGGPRFGGLGSQATLFPGQSAVGEEYFQIPEI